MYILTGMRTRVQRWGNSLALRIPKPLAEEVGLQPSDEVEISLDGGELRVTPARRRWDLETLVSKITEKNAHSEVETGPVRGREAW
jgi:antitoxin MazE